MEDRAEQGNRKGQDLCLVSGEWPLRCMTASKSKWADLLGNKYRQMAESQITSGRGWHHAEEFGYFSVGSPLHFRDVK